MGHRSIMLNERCNKEYITHMPVPTRFMAQTSLKLHIQHKAASNS